MENSAQKSDSIEKYALEAIPAEDRQPWFNIALILIGVMICVPALMMGGALITGLDLINALLAGIIGYTIVVVFMSFQSMQGADLGRPTAVVASSAFGEAGSRILISFILAVATMGWFGVQANVGGAAFSSIVSSWLGWDIAVWLSSLIWGIIMLSTAILGFNALKYLNYVAVPSLVILAIYGTYISLARFGTEMISTYQPPAPFSLLQGIALAVGTFAVGGVIAADFSRYAHGRKDAILAAVIGVWPAGVAMLFMGSVMALVAGTYDITIILSELGIPAIGLIILILATWTTNTVNAYSGGLALTNMFNLSGDKRAIATGIAGALGTVLAVAGILNYFLNYLMLLTSGIPPVAGVMIADYWIYRKGMTASWQKLPGVNWAGVIAWLLGVIAANLIQWGIAPINGIVVSMVCYLVLTALLRKNMSQDLEQKM